MATGISTRSAREMRFLNNIMMACRGSKDLFHGRRCNVGMLYQYGVSSFPLLEDGVCFDLIFLAKWQILKQIRPKRLTLLKPFCFLTYLESESHLGLEAHVQLCF